jgi:hypothetical protein
MAALPAAVRPSPPAPSLGSAIISRFPAIFAEFRGKRFSLLWRGSATVSALWRSTADDGHPNSLTVILDTKKNFGGFPPVEWASTPHEKAGDSQKSCIFTLKDPHRVRARRFALKASVRGAVLDCISQCGPRFGDGIPVSNSSRYTQTLIPLPRTTPDCARQLFSPVRRFQYQRN